MKNILTIAKREIARLRSRFRGRSRITLLLILAVCIVISYVAYQQGFVLSKRFYTIGASPEAPALTDERFNVIAVDRTTGYTMLREKTIDIYIDRNQVRYRNDERSQLAVGALKQSLEKRELIRIADEYDLDKAFPLRIETNYLKTQQDNTGTGEMVSLWEIIGSTETSTEQTARSEPTESTGLWESESRTEVAVMEQLDELDNNRTLPKFKAEFVSDKEIIIPSLMNPPIPLAQVIIAFLYVLPIFFISVFFTSSFMEEKMNRKLNILLSAPVTPFQVIMGKMLPYLGYSVFCVITITLLLKGNVLLALAIFIPVLLFIFSIYLMVALLYRTFKDQTFFSLLAITVITGYLIYPAMLSGISELSSISPLSLAVKMYQGTPFGLSEYFFSTTPMYLVFFLAMFTGVRIFNEEYLTGFRPLHVKLGEAIFFTLNKNHLHASIFFFSLLLIPAVFMVQLISIVIAFNLPGSFALVALLVVSVIVEEIAKSSGIAVLIRHNVAKSLKRVLTLSFAAALGFFIGEKLLLYIALSVISESTFTTAIFGTGLLIVPLIAHFVFTAVVCLITVRFGIRYYPIAILAGSVIHALYNLSVIGVIP